MMEETSYKIQNDKMLRDNKILFSANGKIDSYVVLKNGIVILTDYNSSIELRNVYCYSFNGAFKWQIPPADELHLYNYYTSIYLSNENQLQAFSNNGVEYTLNEENGNVLKKELIK
jgi:hypothetical protein